MESSFASKCWRYAKLSVCLYVLCFFFFFLFTFDCLWPCNLLGSSSLLWSLCVFKHTAVGFLEALKPFVGLFHNGSILSFALVQGVDPGSFVSKWIPMQVWSCNHLVPHHCWVRGQPGRRKLGGVQNIWMCLESLEIKSKWTMATWQISTELLLRFHTHNVELNWGIRGCLGMFITVITALH